MDFCTTERVVDWSSQKNLHAFHFEKDGHHYAWCCTGEKRRECLYSVGLHAANPALNLSQVDAMHIQSRMREVIQEGYGEWVEAEAKPAVDTTEQPEPVPDARWLGWVLVLAGVMWATVGAALVSRIYR